MEIRPARLGDLDGMLAVHVASSRAAYEALGFIAGATTPHERTGPPVMQYAARLGGGG